MLCYARSPLARSGNRLASPDAVRRAPCRTSRPRGGQRTGGLDRDRSDTPDDAMVYVSLTEIASRKAYRGRLEVRLRHGNKCRSIRYSFED